MQAVADLVGYLAAAAAIMLAWPAVSIVGPCRQHLQLVLQQSAQPAWATAAIDALPCRTYNALDKAVIRGNMKLACSGTDLARPPSPPLCVAPQRSNSRCCHGSHSKYE